MQRYSISQLPVVRDGDVDSLADVIGSLQDRDLLDRVFKNPDALHEDVATAMQPPLAAVDADVTRSTRCSRRLTGRTNAVVVRQRGQAGRRADALGPARVPRAPPASASIRQSVMPTSGTRARRRCSANSRSRDATE